MYVAELVTGDPVVFNSESCAAHLPQNPGTPAQSFHSTVFLGGTTTSGNTFRLFVDFSGQFQRNGTISTFITPFLLLPGTFQFIHNIAALLAFLPILKMRTKHPYMMYRLNCQGLVSESLRLACSFRNVPVMKNRKFSLCCKMYPLILRFRFLRVFNSLYLLSF